MKTNKSWVDIVEDNYVPLKEVANAAKVGYGIMTAEKGAK